MIRDEDSPAASNGVEAPDASGLPALPTATADSEPGPKQSADAPDMFAVGVRVLRMAPAWLLAMTVGCSALVLLLGWMNAGRTDAAGIYSPPLNDARSSQPAPRAAAPARLPEPARPADAVAPSSADDKKASEDTKPAPTVAQTASPSPAPSASVAPPQSGEKAQTESPAQGDEAGAKFTVQVGSFNDHSEANARVSGLRAAGFDARAVAVEIQSRGTWYRVQVGHFADRGEGAKTVAGLRAKGAAGAIVVPLQD
jgi:cell division septation protein DedD